MHVRMLAALLAAVVLAAGCGQAAVGGRSTQPPPSDPATVTISGVLVATTSAHTGASPQPGVKIGIYTRPITNAGPVMADPPEPLATARTGADGRFAIELPGTHARYFVSAIDARGYAPGRWARPGVPVKLTACTDCPIPL
jgi:hypothetical protein